MTNAMLPSGETGARQRSSSPTAALGSALGLAMMSVLAAPAALAAQDEPGAQVVRDADTGKLRAPSHEEHKALREQQREARKADSADQDRRGLVSGTVAPAPVRRANGSVALELDESSMSYAVMTRRPDGSLAMQCVTGPQAATRALRDAKSGASTSGKEHGHDHQ